MYKKIKKYISVQFKKFHELMKCSRLHKVVKKNLV